MEAELCSPTIDVTQEEEILLSQSESWVSSAPSAPIATGLGADEGGVLLPTPTPAVTGVLGWEVGGVSTLPR